MQLVGLGGLVDGEQTADLGGDGEPYGELQEGARGDDAPDGGVDTGFGAGGQYRQQDDADPDRADVEDGGDGEKFEAVEE